MATHIWCKKKIKIIYIYICIVIACEEKLAQCIWVLSWKLLFRIPSFLSAHGLSLRAFSVWKLSPTWPGALELPRGLRAFCGAILCWVCWLAVGVSISYLFILVQGRAEWAFPLEVSGREAPGMDCWKTLGWRSGGRADCPPPFLFCKAGTMEKISSAALWWQFSLKPDWKFISSCLRRRFPTNALAFFPCFSQTELLPSALCARGVSVQIFTALGVTVKGST